MTNTFRSMRVPTRSLRIGLTAIIANLLFAQLALAAPLTYSSDTNITLTAGSVTVKASSVADTVVVNAATLVVTMSSTTGGTFVVTSGSNMTVTQTGSGTITQVCNAGPISQVTLTQSAGSSVYTFTPTGSGCTIPNTSGGGASNSGGGGGGGGYVPPPPPVTPIVATSTASSSSTSIVTASSSVRTDTPTPVVPPSTLSLQDRLNALLATLHNLQAQAGQTNAQPSAGTGTSGGSFTRNLSLGMRGSDIKTLQLFLIQQNSGPIAQKLARNGATTLFGPLTKKALIEFQKKHGITPATGYFGPKTRAYINSLGQ